MKLLAIETSSEACSVALDIDGEVMQHFDMAPRGHAALVLPWVEALLATAGMPLSALDAVAFSRGPGSFTSLRIGIGVVQGLAFGADLPVVPVSSLAATAQSVVGQGVDTALVAMDARMQEVYSGRFQVRDGLMQSISQEQVCPAEVVAEGPVNGSWGIGNGFVRFPALAGLADDLEGVLDDAWPNATCIATLAREYLRHHDGLRADQAQPVYLRDKVAEKSRAP